MGIGVNHLGFKFTEGVLMLDYVPTDGSSAPFFATLLYFLTSLISFATRNFKHFASIKYHNTHSLKITKHTHTQP